VTEGIYIYIYKERKNDREMHFFSGEEKKRNIYNYKSYDKTVAFV
jgi:hypothetical protein